ncbi:MAG: 50S ribosomal protein L32 [Candidatus Sumerlaeia bacterium]|nr:50S ribosomal protein L32 [Candidatus Sumerlaeia bacterium]
MPNPKRRKSRAERDRGRTHKKLKALTLNRCPSCGQFKRPHRVCTNPECGMYRGRKVIISTVTT